MNPWFPGGPARGGHRWLVCLPYAGGSAAIYRDWHVALEGRCDVHVLELPGRGARMASPPVTAMASAVACLAEQLEVSTGSWWMFGYSLGALLAFELARECRRRGQTGPEQLVVAAAEPPHVPRARRGLHELPDRELVERLGDWGGIPEAVREHEGLLRLMVPALRADLRLLETYCFQPEPPLSCPILAYAGARDRIASAAAMSEWRVHTNGKFELQTLPGGHFFLDASRRALLTSLAIELAR